MGELQIISQTEKTDFSFESGVYKIVGSATHSGGAISRIDASVFLTETNVCQGSICEFDSQTSVNLYFKTSLLDVVSCYTEAKTKLISNIESN